MVKKNIVLSNTTNFCDRPSLVILDRDGVINEDSDLYIKSVSQWKAIPGSISAIKKLKKKKLKLLLLQINQVLLENYIL